MAALLPYASAGQIVRSGDELRNEFWTLTGRLPVNHETWTRTELFQRVEACKLLMEEEKLREARLWEVYNVIGGRHPCRVEEYSLRELDQRIQAAVQVENGWGGAPGPKLEEVEPAVGVGRPADRLLWTKEDRAELRRGQTLHGSSFRGMSRDQSLLFQPALMGLSEQGRAKRLKSYASSSLYLKYCKEVREEEL